jgi:tRNA (mo5U34)-methyltransferase
MTDLTPAIAALEPWFHNLHLPGGIQTCPNHPLGDFPSFKWQALQSSFASDLSGASVLDIGCNAGFYALELARRGATVTAIDVDEHYLNQARWAARVCGLSERIHFEQRQVYSLARAGRRWDIVLFLGVLYHLRYPMLGLDIVSRCVDKQLIVQSLSTNESARYEVPPDLELDDREPLSRPGWPKLSFIEHRLAGDQTNWWAPNPACLEAMLRSAGLRVVARPADEFYSCEPDPENRSSMWTWNEPEYLAAVSGGVL